MIPFTIAEHARKHGITPLKKYGQNFIFDSTLCDKIVRASGFKEGDTVLEVGPGTAGLTRSILACRPASLTVIETDRRMIPLLEEIKEHYPHLHIIKEDALKYDISRQISKESKIRIISNLPYNVGTQLIINWLKSASLIENITVMLQKEVVERMHSSQGSKSYGRLSVLCQLICKVEKCFDVSREAFYPPPKVESSIVKLSPKAGLPPPNIIAMVEKVTQMAFSQRRKMVKSSLKTLSNIEAALENLKIPPSARAGDISPEQYLSIAGHVFL